MAYQAAISKAEFIVPLHIAVSVMEKTRNLVKALQKVDLDFSEALDQINTVVKALEHVRQNASEEFHAIYTEVEEMAEKIGTFLSPPRIVGHHNYRKKGSNQSAESYYLDAAFIPFLNHFIAEIKSRFGGHNADVLMLQGLIPS